MPTSRRVFAVGAASLAIGAVHDARHVARGETADLLWMCNVSCPLLGVACIVAALADGRVFAMARTAVAVATTWLGFGAPLWTLELCAHGGAPLSSFAVHLIGGLVLGLVAVRAARLPARRVAARRGRPRRCSSSHRAPLHRRRPPT